MRPKVGAGRQSLSEGTGKGEEDREIGTETAEEALETGIVTGTGEGDLGPGPEIEDVGHDPGRGTGEGQGLVLVIVVGGQGRGPRTGQVDDQEVETAVKADVQGQKTEKKNRQVKDDDRHCIFPLSNSHSHY